MRPLLSRVVVALVGLPLVLVIVWAGGWWLFALAGVAAILALHEYALMIRSLRPVILAAYAGALLSLLGAHLGGLEWTMAGSSARWCSRSCCTGSPRRGSRRRWRSLPRCSARAGSACVLHIWCSCGRSRSEGELATFTVLLAVWAGDIGAFFAGRLIGRHKLAPALSPGKTWEGFLFGTAATIFVAFVALYKQHYISIPQSIVLGAVIAIAAPLGDLFESALKRDMQVKDSGRLLAAHGGVLDRIDSLLFAVVASYYVLRAFNAA